MEKYTGFEIAVIGMAGQFPGAADIPSFWENLKNGVESISHFSTEELLNEGVDSSLLANPAYVRANGFLENKEFFDAAFFDYRPDEAQLMDPQMRLLHECVWNALEDAGYNVYAIEGRVGLFTGASVNMAWQTYAMLESSKFLTDSYYIEFLKNSNFSNSRISYLLNLRGPSISLDTACSTSLVAVHQACNSLLLGECYMAMAGGVCAKTYSRAGYLHQEGMIASSDGHCRTFDAKADGTVGGEGVGIVVLKRLKNAIADRDNILAVIKGTGINNDGANKVGYTAPGVDGQSEAILMACNMAKVDPQSIGYVEAHGTGTPQGDPVEVEALNRAFGKSDRKYCALGSVKSNIGHTDVAAGVAGLIKVVLALKHRQIPASLHFSEPNPGINFQGSPFYVNTGLKEWKRDGNPLRAGVSSFGIGGTNAHLVLEEAPAGEPSSSSRKYQLLVLSGKTPAALEGNTQKLSAYLEANRSITLPDMAYTLQTGRVPFAYRKALVCHDVDEALEKLSERRPADRPAQVFMDRRPLLVFMFPGQGSQYTNMCRDLYRSEPVFRTELDLCMAIAKDRFGLELKSVLFPEQDTGAGKDIDLTLYTQPALFAVEYSLARLLWIWGIKPDMMIGHSLGDYVAACLSGVFSLEDALGLVIKRGELMQRTGKGCMLSVSISEKELLRYIEKEKRVSLASVNSSELMVVAGEEAPVCEFKMLLEAEGYKTRFIRTSHAFHSFLMDGILEEFALAVGRSKRQAPSLPFISSLSGEPVTEKEVADPAYWRDHLRKPVRFAAGIQTLLGGENVVFVEVGPGKVLSTFVQSHEARSANHKVISLVRPAHEVTDDNCCLLRGLGELWTCGIEPCWTSFYEIERRRRIALPTYVFDKVKYPAHVDPYKMIAETMASNLPAKLTELSQWFHVPVWKLLPVSRKYPLNESGRCVLLFADPEGIVNGLAEEIARSGGKVIYVAPGKRFYEKSPFWFEIDAEREGDYRALFSSLKSHELYPDVVVHAWNLTSEAEPGYSDSSFTAFFYSLVEVARSYQAVETDADKRLVVLTNHVQAVMDDTEISGMKSMSLGLLKVISQEFPVIGTTHIDISKSEINAFLWEDICREMHVPETGRTICFRHGRKWEEGYQEVSVSEGGPGRSFRTGGVYLITGGLGALGCTIAGCLCRDFQSSVVLLGRTRLPPRSGWDMILKTDSYDASIKEKVSKLQALEREGARVLYLDCDIADEAALEAAVGVAELQLGPINGVIHAAGILSGNSVRSLIDLQREDFMEQFGPKIKGLEAVKGVMEKRRLDFCIITSSLSTVLGGLEFGAYAAANTFMDYYIECHKRKGRLENWVCVDLDGLGFDGKNKDVINREELWEVFKKALSFDHVHRLIVSATNLQERLKRWIYRKDIAKDAITAHAEDCVSPSTDLEARLAEIWCRLLEIDMDKLSVTSSFFELGGNSLIAPILLSNLFREFGVRVRLKHLYRYPTIATLSEFLSEEMQVQLIPANS
jgi:iturin family lipopeptide synthetase A